MEAGFFKKIATSERFFSPYFMVGYYGKGFDSTLSGKQFIHKGFELEGTSDFTSRLKTRFPKAEILKLNEFKTPTEYLNQEGQCNNLTKTFLALFLQKKFFFFSPSYCTCQSFEQKLDGRKL